MTITVKGIYRDGRIELSEKPAEVPEGSDVVVTIQSPVPTPREHRQMYFGMFAGPEKQMSTEEDFKEARRSIWGNTDAK